jgi:endogenous inhibitor of DNA gyrase (YacG/DUF329 family)
MASATCPTCGKAFDPAHSHSVPFCSPRCRQIDLRRWLNEKISIPFREVDQPDHPRRSKDEEQEE